MQLDDYPLQEVCEWEIGQHSISDLRSEDLLGAVQHDGNRAETVHHALGSACAARRVRDEGGVLGLTRGIPPNRIGSGYDRIPRLIVVRGRKRKRDARHALGDAFSNLSEVVELAHE